MRRFVGDLVRRFLWSWRLHDEAVIRLHGEAMRRCSHSSVQDIDGDVVKRLHGDAQMKCVGELVKPCRSWMVKRLGGDPVMRGHEPSNQQCSDAAVKQSGGAAVIGGGWSVIWLQKSNNKQKRVRAVPVKPHPAKSVNFLNRAPDVTR